MEAFARFAQMLDLRGFGSNKFRCFCQLGSSFPLMPGHRSSTCCCFSLASSPERTVGRDAGEAVGLRWHREHPFMMSWWTLFFHATARMQLRNSVAEHALHLHLGCFPAIGHVAGDASSVLRGRFLARCSRLDLRPRVVRSRCTWLQQGLRWPSRTAYTFLLPTA